MSGLKTDSDSANSEEDDKIVPLDSHQTKLPAMRQSAPVIADLQTFDSSKHFDLIVGGIKDVETPKSRGNT